MNIINDSAFGEMTYRHTWKKTEIIGENIKLTIIVKDSDGQGISDAQRKAYMKFKKSPEVFFAKASEALAKYIAQIYPNIQTYTMNPQKVLFKQDGVWGFLYPSPIGEDDGLSVRFENGHVIADMDDALF